MEIVADNGDIWVVRCCEDPGCVVIEQFMTKTPPEGFDALVQKYADLSAGDAPKHPEGEPDEDPTHDVHIPLDVLADLLAGLKAAGEEARAQMAADADDGGN